MNEAADSGRTRIAGVPSETVAEAVFLVLIAAAFVYLLIVSRGWPMAAALLPTIASGVGLPLLIIHIYRRFRQVSRQRRRILDIGFTDEGLERRVVHLRTVQMLGTMVAMFVGIWLVGFHIALPLYVFLYLVTFGEVRWWWALVAAAIFEAILVGLYDSVLHTTWNEPVLQGLLGIGR